MFFIVHQLESHSNYIAPLCHSSYSCAVDFPIFRDLEQLLKLYSYRQCCKSAFSSEFLADYIVMPVGGDK